MKFSTKADIDAPVETVFAALTDFAGFEKSARRRGATMTRTDALAAPGVGMTWSGKMPFRGRQRQITLRVAGYTPPTGLHIAGETPNLEMTGTIEVIALSRTRTRLQAGLDVRPRTLTARLLLQSAKLGKSSLDKKFRQRVQDFAHSVTARRTQVPTQGQ